MEGYPYPNRDNREVDRFSFRTRLADAGEITLVHRLQLMQQVSSLAEAQALMDPDRLFLERCRQVEELMQSHNEIDLLDLSAVLRQLLLDDHPLIHAANAKHRLKLRFRAGEFRNRPDVHTAVLSLEDGLDPETRPPGSPSKEVNFDGLIGHIILFINGQGHSIRDVIKLASDVAGGVHAGNAKDRQKLIAEYSAHFGIGGLPGAIRQLKAIARVTLRGLHPLVQAIQKG